MIRRSSLIALIIAVLCAGQPARANESPFEGQLQRLAEILGALHYLRNLCGESGQEWRARMETLLETEAGTDSARRERFVSSFNRGYSGFESTYTSCTASAIEAINRYMREGEALTRDTASRFGN
jgi:uncharacterized protein (TIGR02301 family)